jgi:hypothetical protein
MSAMLIAVLILGGQLGSSDWCYVPPGSEQLFCDYVSLSSCQSAHQHEQGGACVPRPRQQT